jgi:DNA-directed RNA polymerase subunit RPC12/RpoP
MLKYKFRFLTRFMFWRVWWGVLSSDSQIKASIGVLRVRVEGFKRFLEGLEPHVLPCTPTRRWVVGEHGSKHRYWYMVCKDGGVGRSVYVGPRPPRGIRKSEYRRALRLAGRLSEMLEALERGLEEMARLEAELLEKVKTGDVGARRGGAAVRVEYVCSGCGGAILAVDLGNLNNRGLMTTWEVAREIGGACPRCGRILAGEPLKVEVA